MMDRELSDDDDMPSFISGKIIHNTKYTFSFFLITLLKTKKIR